MRTRVQGKDECFRDFAYMYRSLCHRWRPDISEGEVIKLILKNSNPRLTSQLQSSGVDTVDGLVRLGQQLEKDRHNQRMHEQRIQSLGKPQIRQDNSAKPVAVDPPTFSKPPGLFYWHCKGSHTPAT